MNTSAIRQAQIAAGEQAVIDDLAAKGFRLSTTPTAQIQAQWSFSLDCECPACHLDVDLLRAPDFWHDHPNLKAVENGTEQSCNLEVICPECSHEFNVECIY